MTLIYDNYEISPCRRHEEPDAPGRFFHDVCEPRDADVWTLYGHRDGRGVEAIGDFASIEAAEQVYFRITGEPFAGSSQAAARVRLMHAAPKLLAALEGLLDLAENEAYALDKHKDSPEAEAEARRAWEAVEAARDAIAAATDARTPEVPDEPDIDALLDRRHQIAVVWSVDDVREIRPDLSDEQAWEVLQDARHGHDATIGINWDVLACHADALFPHAPQSHDAREVLP